MKVHKQTWPVMSCTGNAPALKRRWTAARLPTPAATCSPVRPTESLALTDTCWFNWISNYSHDPKIGHSKSGFIWKPDILKIGIWIGWPFHGSVFECHLKTRQKDHSKTGPFHVRSTFDHLKTGHVRFLDPHFIQSFLEIKMLSYFEHC